MINNRVLVIRIASLLLLSIGIAIGFNNCSEVRLQPKPDLPVVAAKQGVVCTKTPNFLESLNRYMFIMDMSESMNNVDPHNPITNTTRRVDGLRRLIEKFKDDDNFTMTIGALHNDGAGFLPDAGAGAGAVPSLQTNCSFVKPRVDAGYQNLQTSLEQLDSLSSQTLGNSPFKSLFKSAGDCIESDLRSNSQGRYSIVIVTDGSPTDTTPQELKDLAVELVKKGKIMAEDPVEASRVNIYFYFMDNFNGNPDGAIMMTDAILASQGAGGYGSKIIISDDGGEVDYNELGIFANKKYVLKHFVASNVNASLNNDGVFEVDSDGDGLTDKKEIELGYNNLKYSSNDNCSDLIHFRNGGSCPTTCLTGRHLIDSDHDGFSDCDDISMSTNPYHFDRDGDMIYDGLEFRIGSNPLDPNDFALDMDLDGMNSFEESNQQTGVFHDDRGIDHDTLVDVSIQEVDPQDGQRCYSISVSGIPIFNTQTVMQDTILPIQHEQEGNIIKLMFFQVMEDDPTAPPVLQYSYKTLYYTDFGGNRGYIENFEDYEFQIYTPRGF